MAPVHISTFERLVDLKQPSLWLAVASICFNPLYWNIVARQEYKRKLLTRLFGGYSRLANYALAGSILSLGLVRDSLFKDALKYQPRLPLLNYGEMKLVALGLFTFGTLLVVTSTYKLGFTGTFLGDYFGYLLDSKVESFPFNICENPMYVGSTLCFLATSIWYESPIGLILTLLVHVVYRIACSYEEPFTNSIYEARERQRRLAANYGDSEYELRKQL